MARVKTGTIYKLPSGRWLARYTAPGGKRFGRTFLTKADGNAFLHQQYAAISDGTWERSSALTVILFRDFAANWLAHRTVKGRPLAARTREGYQDLLDRFILDTFGPRPLNPDAITREDVDSWYARTAKNSPTSRARAYGLLRTILGSATDDGYFLANPARIRGAGQVSRRHQVRPATLDELAALTLAMPPRYRLLVQLAAFCALRFGELTELRRGDIDTSRGVIMVRRAVVFVRGGTVVKTPKSEAGVRDVAIPPTLMPMVREHLLAHTAPGADGLLFPSKHDPATHLRQGSLTRVYYPARQEAGRPDLRFHDLRHTGAVLAAQTGATLAELMARLGHSTSQAALRYQHAALGRDQVIADRLSAMIELAAQEAHRAT